MKSLLARRFLNFLCLQVEKDAIMLSCSVAEAPNLMKRQKDGEILWRGVYPEQSRMAS
jgi:hypothetical protein